MERSGPRAAFDVVVVGAGNAGLTAAIAAREAGASVLVLEKAPEAERGGDTAFTGGLFRFAFNGMDEIRELVPDYTEIELADVEIDRYAAQDYANDIDRTSEGLAHPDLVDELVRSSYDTMLWLNRRCGVRWMLATGRQFVILSPHVVLLPGLAIFVMVLALNVVGDALRDLLDPRTHSA